MIITVLAFVLTLGVLIVIHEYGHYRVAVACGVKVLRFSVGFGRVLWRRQATPDSTEFVVCALPLGGYVKMLDEREGPVSPDQLDRSFNRKRLWQRAAIVAAGPAANLLLGLKPITSGDDANVANQDTSLPLVAPWRVELVAGLALMNTSACLILPLISLASASEPPPSPSYRYPLARANLGPMLCSIRFTREPA